MSTDSAYGHAQYPLHGQIGYVQIPTRDVSRSASFYAAVFGWHGEVDFGSFEAPGLIGQWSLDLPVSSDGGPILWLWVDDLGRALSQVIDHGGTVSDQPRLDHGKRWLVEVHDPAGNRIGIVARARTAAPQPMIAVRDVEASSRWYQQLLGFVSDHGGPDYERLLADGLLVLQLHRSDVDHHHGPVMVDQGAPVGNGVLLWFGEVTDFDNVVARASEMGVTVTRPPHRNPPDADGNGPSHREIWLQDLDGYIVVIASPDGESWLSEPPA